MLRLTLEETTPSVRRLVAEGQLIGEWATLLELECNRLSAGAETVAIDLSGVSAVDASGLRVLERLSGGPTRLENLSPLIQAMLKE